MQVFKRYLTLLTISALPFFWPELSRADLLILDPGLENNPDASGALVVIRIHGQITGRDVTVANNLTKTVIRTIRKPVVVIAELDSPGGEVSAAVELGRLLRKHKALAKVEDGSICASACVFVLAGATNRNVVGEVLIHRPYNPDDQVTSATLQKEKYSALRKEVAKFLDEVNISTSLYDDMLRISPDEARALSASDLEKYGLSADDPYEDEANDVKEAKRLGVSRQEYGRRKTRSRTVCKSDDLPPLEDHTMPEWLQWAECDGAVMEGKR